jgi:hypothetical protein
VADVARALEERKRVSKTLHMHIVPAGQIRTEGCCVDQLNPPPIADIDQPLNDLLNSHPLLPVC